MRKDVLAELGAALLTAKTSHVPRCAAPRLTSVQAAAAAAAAAASPAAAAAASPAAAAAAKLQSAPRRTLVHGVFITRGVH